MVTNPIHTDIVEKATALNIHVNKTTKSGKIAWELAFDGNTLVVPGNQATIETLDFLSKTRGEKFETPIKTQDRVLEKPNKTTEVMKIIVDNPGLSIDEIAAQMHKKGREVKKSTISVMISDVRKTLSYLQQSGRLLTK